MLKKTMKVLLADQKLLRIRPVPLHKSRSTNRTRHPAQFTHRDRHTSQSETQKEITKYYFPWFIRVSRLHSLNHPRRAPRLSLPEPFSLQDFWTEH